MMSGPTGLLVGCSGMPASMPVVFIVMRDIHYLPPLWSDDSGLLRAHAARAARTPLIYARGDADIFLLPWQRACLCSVFSGLDEMAMPCVLPRLPVRTCAAPRTRYCC